MHNLSRVKGISKYRMYELQYFCLQYRQWGRDLHSGRADGDEARELAQKRAMIERTAKMAGGDIADYILEAVTEPDVTYNYLRSRGMPCGKGYFYDRRGRFYAALDKLRR